MSRSKEPDRKVLILVVATVPYGTNNKQVIRLTTKALGDENKTIAVLDISESEASTALWIDRLSRYINEED